MKLFFLYSAAAVALLVNVQADQAAIDAKKAEIEDLKDGLKSFLISQHNSLLNDRKLAALKLLKEVKATKDELLAAPYKKQCGPTTAASAASAIAKVDTMIANFKAKYGKLENSKHEKFRNMYANKLALLEGHKARYAAVSATCDLQEQFMAGKQAVVDALADAKAFVNKFSLADLPEDAQDQFNKMKEDFVALLKELIELTKDDGEEVEPEPTQPVTTPPVTTELALSIGSDPVLPEATTVDIDLLGGDDDIPIGDIGDDGSDDGSDDSTQGNGLGDLDFDSDDDGSDTSDSDDDSDDGSDDSDIDLDDDLIDSDDDGSDTSDSDLSDVLGDDDSDDGSNDLTQDLDLGDGVDDNGGDDNPLDILTIDTDVGGVGGGDDTIDMDDIDLDGLGLDLEGMGDLTGFSGGISLGDDLDFSF